MPGMNADHLLTALAVLVPLAGGAVLLWQRTTAGLRESVAWRARVDARLNNIDRRLDVGDERMGKYSDGLAEVRKCLSEIKILLGRGRRADWSEKGLMTDTAIIDAILRREGGFVDHPADQGGPTKYGVTQRTLKQYRGRSVTVGDLRDLGESEARLIYQRLYISGPEFDRITGQRLRALVIDCAVNHGPSRATRWLQAWAGTRVDGVFGPLTLAAVNAAEQEPLYKRVLAQRCRFYGQIIARDPSQAAFAAGWTARLAEFIEEAV